MYKYQHELSDRRFCPRHTIRIMLRSIITFLLIISLGAAILIPLTVPIEVISAASSGSDASESIPSEPVSPASSDTVTSSEPSETSSISETPASSTTVLFDSEGNGAPAIDGTAYVLYDVETKTFLLGNNADSPLPPASITKVMTILLALENLSMTDTITVTREMYENIPGDYVRVGLVEGEVITVEEAIYSCLLISANDAAMALAIKMGGTVEGFSEMMNSRAVELGCTHTNFNNPFGFGDPQHLTTAHDMALIMAEALTHEEYSKISTTANYSFPPTNKRVDPISLRNGNKFVSTTEFAYDKYIGGKTGFTDLSAYTITAGAKNASRTLVAVILGASSSNIRYQNLSDLFEYGFSTYSPMHIQSSDFSAMQNLTIEQIKASITSANLALQVTNVELELIPFLMVYSTKTANGYTDTIDTKSTVIQTSEPVQILRLPIYRQYADGTSDTLGTLIVTICDEVAAETHSVAEVQQPVSPADIGMIVLRIGVIFVLTVILGIVIVLFLRFQRAKNHKRARRKPKVL